MRLSAIVILLSLVCLSINPLASDEGDISLASDEGDISLASNEGDISLASNGNNINYENGLLTRNAKISDNTETDFEFLMWTGQLDDIDDKLIMFIGEEGYMAIQFKTLSVDVYYLVNLMSPVPTPPVPFPLPLGNFIMEDLYFKPEFMVLINTDRGDVDDDYDNWYVSFYFWRFGSGDVQASANSIYFGDPGGDPGAKEDGHVHHSVAVCRLRDGDLGYQEDLSKRLVSNHDKDEAYDFGEEYFEVPGLYDYIVGNPFSDIAAFYLTLNIARKFVVDDDTEGPTISMEYHGGYTDANPGYIDVIASDPSGIKDAPPLYEDPTGRHYLDPFVGTKTFYFEATDDDNDMPFDSRTTRKSMKIVLTDDDSTPPVINVVYWGGGTDANPGHIEVTAHDSSGLSLDPSTIIAVPSEPGHYEWVFKATDNDNDRAGDRLTRVLTYGITIVDDDTEAPVISITYNGDYTDGNAGYIEVVASDNSGLSLDPSGIYKVNHEIVGTPQHFEFRAIDDDDEREGDELTTVESISITLFDDDTSPPEIDIAYNGLGNDESPGTWLVNAVDHESGIDEIEVHVDGILAGTSTGEYAVPNSLGSHEIEVFANNADLDRGKIDQERGSASDEVVIVDDDTTPPVISDVVISKNVTHLVIRFNGEDDSGIAAMNFIFDGKPLLPVNQYHTGSAYIYEFTAGILFESITLSHTVDITVIDADNDRDFDELATTVTVSFEITVPDLLAIVDHELVELASVVEENTNHPYDHIIVHHLNKARCKIDQALEYYLKGDITKSVLVEKLSKIFFEISEVITWIADWKDKIDSNFAIYLTGKLHQLRDRTTYIMGASVGTETSMMIADVEIQISQFADGIYGTLPFIKGFILDLKLWQACNKLDLTLVYLANGNETLAADAVAGANHHLEQAKQWVSVLLKHGCIAEEQAEELLVEIDTFIAALQVIP